MITEIDVKYGKIIINFLKNIKRGVIKDIKVKQSSNDIFEKTSELISDLNIGPIKWQDKRIKR